MKCEGKLGGHILDWFLNSFLGSPRYCTWEISDGLARGFHLKKRQVLVALLDAEA